MTKPQLYPPKVKSINQNVIRSLLQKVRTVESPLLLVLICGGLKINIEDKRRHFILTKLRTNKTYLFQLIIHNFKCTRKLYDLIFNFNTPLII